MTARCWCWCYLLLALVLAAPPSTLRLCLFLFRFLCLILLLRIDALLPEKAGYAEVRAYVGQPEVGRAVRRARAPTWLSTSALLVLELVSGPVMALVSATEMATDRSIHRPS